jgi:heptosyltransferase III
MSTLFYHSGALGDFLTVLPAIRAWRLTHPREKVVLLGKPSFGAIARRSGYIDEVWDVGSISNAWLFSLQTAVPENARAMYAAIGVAVLFAAPDSPVGGRLLAAGVGKIHSQTPFPVRRTPAVAYHLSFVPGLTLLLDHFGPIILSDPAFKKDALQLLGGIDDYIVIHPGSGSAIKNWPFEFFGQFSEKCKQCGLSVVWMYGEAEKDLPAASGSLVVRNEPLPILVHLLKMSTAYIGNDSGISHLAAGAGCRCVVLFGPSDDVVWGPRGAHVTIVKARRTCAPCHPFRDGSRRCGDSCMRRLSVDEVFEAFVRTVGEVSVRRGP